MYYACVSARISIAVTFLLLAVGSYVGFEVFSEYTKALVFVPWSVRRLLAVLLPLAAVILAMAMLFGRYKRRWIVLTYVALAFCAGCLIIAVISPWDPQCNCPSVKRFAQYVKYKSLIYLVLDAILLGLASVAFFEDTFMEKTRLESKGR